MEQDIVETQNKELTPGFGAGGVVICPLMSITHSVPCSKGGCEWWTELSYGDRKVARCALYWMAILPTEIRGAIDKVANLFKQISDEDKPQTQHVEDGV